MRRLLSPWDRRAGTPDSHSPARTNLLSGKEAVNYLRVKLSLPHLRTSCVSLPVFLNYFLAESLLGFGVLSVLVLNFAQCGTLVQTRIVDATTCLSQFSLDSRELTSIQITEE